MKPIAVVAIGAESALGAGSPAYSVGEVGELPRTAIAPQERLRAFGLEKPFAAVIATSPESALLDPAAVILRRVASALAASLDSVLPGWRTLRVGIAIGTSSGGMDPLTRALDSRARGENIPLDVARSATYFGPLAVLGPALGVRPAECVQVLAACASSAIAVGLGCRWLELGRVDVALAGGYDALTPFVASGFESLGATSATRPSPFRGGRDGMALGEAATLFGLCRVDDATGKVVGYVHGFGAASDAVHVTAPDREGAGLTRAAQAALRDAALDPSAVDLVSAHATATPFNDAAEARALRSVLGARAPGVVVHPFKAVVGHTLGASAALESAAAFDAMNRGVMPAAAGTGLLDTETPVRLLERNEAGTIRHTLKLSAAFGGANASLVLASVRGDGAPLLPGGVVLASVGEPRTARDVVQLDERVMMPRVQLSRMDPLSAAAVAAVEAALRRCPDFPRERAGVVVGTIAATLENNEAFDARLRQRGASGAEPRRFPPTSPNLPAGQCSIAFGLKGPSFAVGAGPAAPLEALLTAFDLLEAGDADVMVVVAAEHVGPAVTDIFRAAGWPCPQDGALAAVLTRGEPGGVPFSRTGCLDASRAALAPGAGPLAPGWPTFGAILGGLRPSSEGGGSDPRNRP